MSMRIEGQMDIKIARNTRSTETRAAGPENTTGHMLAPLPGTDNVSLSSTSGLVALAKSLTPGDKQARVAVLISQVRSGQYHAGASETSRAVVQGHFKS